MRRDMVQVPSPKRTESYQAPTMRYGRSQFNLGHRHKTSFDAGQLIPYLCVRVMPGDTMTCKLQAFARIFSPLSAPVMDDISMDIDFWYVPWRTLWTNYKAFLGEHDDAGAQDTTYTMPTLSTATVITETSLASYFGVPKGMNTSWCDVNALPFRAYRFIYDQFYRDQNLINSETFPLDDGPDGNGETGWNDAPLKSAKKPDYFTTALPYLQKGTASEVALSGLAPLKTEATVAEDITILDANDAYRTLEIDGGTSRLQWASGSSGASTEQFYADLSQATSGITINALREAAAIQRFLELSARGGTRHREIIKTMFGVDIPDFRTQVPEYLGGGSGYINVSPVANTSATATEDQGQLAGVGTGTLQGSFSKSFVEFGFVIGILRARGEITYQQGLDPMFSRMSTKYDLPWPQFSMLGEQPIYNKEIFLDGTNEELVFGYQERHAEWRFKKSLVTGVFHSDHSASVDFWHLAEDFAALPTLGQTFVEDATPMARVVADTTGPDFIIDGFFDLRVARALPVRPVPTLAPARF